MTITLGVYGATDATGWTSFSGNQPSNGGTVYYVSSSLTGASDSNNGTFPTFTSGTNGPFLTLSKGMAVLNAGGAGVDNWLLLRMGDTFSSQVFGDLNPSGKAGTFNNASGTWAGRQPGDADSTTWSGAPILISSYDENFAVVTYGPDPIQSSNARPIVALNNSANALVIHGDNIALIGIEIYDSIRDPNNTATTLPFFDSAQQNNGVSCFTIVGATTFCLLEDNKFSFMGGGINTAGGGGTQPNGFTVRKNIITDAYNVGNPTAPGHSVGADINTADDLVFEENTFDHNGWNQTLGFPLVAGERVFNHNFYLQADTGISTVRGNIISNDASGSEARSNARIYDNIFIGNRYAFQGIANGYDSNYISNYYDNVITEMSADNQIITTVTNFAGLYSNFKSFNCYRNIFCNSTSFLSQSCIIGYPSQRNVLIYSNIFYNMSGSREITFSGSFLTYNQNCNGSIYPYNTALTITTNPATATNGTHTDIDLVTLTGSGTGAKATFTVAGNVVTSIRVSAPNFDIVGHSNQTDFTLGGYNYAVNNTVGVVSFAPGLVCTIASVTSGSSESSNNTDIFPSVGSYPYPLTATVGDYAGTISLSATSAAFITAARGQTKQNWNYRYTANKGAVPYIQAGFGIGGGTPTPPPPPIPISHGKHVGKPTKIPHI